MISTALLSPLTLCTTAVSLPSPSFSSSSTCPALSSSSSSSSHRIQPSPFSSLLSTSSSHASPLLFFSSLVSALFIPRVSFLWSLILVLLSSLFLPLRPLVLSHYGGSGSTFRLRRSKLTSPSTSPSRLLLAIFLLVLTISATPTGAAPPINNTEQHSGFMLGEGASGIDTNPMVRNHDTTGSLAMGTTAASPSSTAAPSSGEISDNSTSPQPLDKRMLKDAPPRRVANRANPIFPENWSVTQGRAFYLRNKLNQYLQIFNGTFLGTLETRPSYGIIQSYSHKGYNVMIHMASNKPICMDANFNLYLGTDLESDDCLMKELPGMNDSHGSYRHIYHFPHRSSNNQTTFLGLDCDPMPRVHKPRKLDFARFMLDNINNETLKAKMAELRRKEDAGTHRTLLREKCQSQRVKQRKQVKAKKRNLRQVTCWRLPRLMARKKEDVLRECRASYYELCTEYAEVAAPQDKVRQYQGGDCVCHILKNMLDNPKRSKRKCLAEKLNLWIAKRNGTPNSAAVVQASKLFLPGYRGIARRMRDLAAKKGEDGRKRDRRRGSRRKKLRMNKVLNKFGEELMVAESEHTTQKSHQTRQDGSKQPSILSPEFVRAIAEQTAPFQRHRHRERRGRRRKERLERRGRRRKHRTRHGRLRKQSDHTTSPAMS